MNTGETCSKNIVFFCSFPRAIDLLSGGYIDVDAMITHHFSLEQSQEAFDTASTLESNSIKVMIHCNPQK